MAQNDQRKELTMRIIVPLDLSEVAAEAVAPALDIARGLGDEMQLVTVLSRRLNADLAELAETQNTTVPDMVESYLKSIVRGFNGVSGTHSVITGDDAALSLIGFGEGEAIRMIVMATHGRSGFERWRLGSVTERVVRHSELPVLVIPTRKSKRDRPEPG
jgi:nucleotide-binding universal stress UspA family protein